ncbi:MAG: hypothetical protein NT069_32830 [Planctomycetota bacterium]|nr:hypothetical protein [Planctomycetota bacterium]
MSKNLICLQAKDNDSMLEIWLDPTKVTAIVEYSPSDSNNPTGDWCRVYCGGQSFDVLDDARQIADLVSDFGGTLDSAIWHLIQPRGSDSTRDTGSLSQFLEDLPEGLKEGLKELAKGLSGLATALRAGPKNR